MDAIQKQRMYSQQDDLLIAIADDDRPLPVNILNQLPPYRAWLVARIAKKAGVPLEFGTVEQLEAEAKEFGEHGKLGQWWLRDLRKPDRVLYGSDPSKNLICVKVGTPAEVKTCLEGLDDIECILVARGSGGPLMTVKEYMETFKEG